MTEAEWLTSTDPVAMLRTRAEPERVLDLVLDILESDNPPKEDDLFWRNSNRALWYGLLRADADPSLFRNPAIATTEWPPATGLPRGWAIGKRTAEGLRDSLPCPVPEVADFVRCITPYRPVRLNKAWLTPTVVAVAAGVVGDGAFDRLPVLADALEDAGCQEDSLLTHLRGPGPHCRGCWVLALLMPDRATL